LGPREVVEMAKTPPHIRQSDKGANLRKGSCWKISKTVRKVRSSVLKEGHNGGATGALAIKVSRQRGETSQKKLFKVRQFEKSIKERGIGERPGLKPGEGELLGEEKKRPNKKVKEEKVTTVGQEKVVRVSAFRATALQ